MTCKKIHKLVRFDVNILHLYIFSVGLHKMVKLYITSQICISSSIHFIFVFVSVSCVYIPDSGVNGIYLAASIKFYITKNVIREKKKIELNLTLVW